MCVIFISQFVIGRGGGLFRREAKSIFIVAFPLWALITFIFCVCLSCLFELGV